MKDWRGNEIKIGSLVVYPGRRGSMQWMTEGRVMDLHPGDSRPVQDWDRTPDSVTLRRLREINFGTTREVNGKLVEVQNRLLTVVKETT